MGEKIYVIEMQTPLGIRHGTIKVNINQGELSGYLNVMNHTEPFFGKIDEDGRCKFSGKIITLMRTIQYEAAGRIKENQISLAIYGERNVFQVVGMERPNVS